MIGYLSLILCAGLVALILKLGIKFFFDGWDLLDRLKSKFKNK